MAAFPTGGAMENLKSVVIKRGPEVIFNTQFLDFARHYGFSVYPCTPGRANEKGRVERVIGDIGRFLAADTFRDMDDLNRKFTVWRTERNRKVHRSTGKAPCDLLPEEKLKALSQIPYQACRIKTAIASATGFVSFDTNRLPLLRAFFLKP